MRLFAVIFSMPPLSDDGREHGVGAPGGTSEGACV